jgi:hypothetical protein
VAILQTPQKQTQSPTVSKTPAPITVHEYVKRSTEDEQYDWKQPINFYGHVIDESNNPVADANAHFNWTDLSEKGTSSADAKSDGNGFFSLTDRKGKRMSVTVSKDGYYTYPSEKLSSYEYANPADGLFTPNQNNPVVFHLRKKGAGVDLISSKSNLSPDLAVHIPRDGTPTWIDFMQKKVGDSGQMQIAEIKPEYKSWKLATNWSFRVKIPDGGFVEENDEFQFEAPQDGYQSVMDFEFQKGNVDWVINLKKNYYIKFGNPPLYGRLQIMTGISYGGATLTYAINPNGSRNLEPK